MSLDLPGDGRDRIADEVDSMAGIEPVDRVDQSDGRCLDEIVERFASTVVADRQVTRQWQERADDLRPEVGPVRVVGVGGDESGQQGGRRVVVDLAVLATRSGAVVLITIYSTLRILTCRSSRGRRPAVWSSPAEVLIGDRPAGGPPG